MNADILSPQERIMKVAGVAVKMAPAFRDKYDFSQTEHYAGVADHAWLAAEALVKKEETMIAAQVAKEESANAEKEAKK